MSKPTVISNIAYWALFSLLKAVALLPLRVLYVLSDGVYLLIYRVFRYRRPVIRQNLTKCFPDKSLKEITEIEKKFYRNFADYIFETIKLLHISDKTIKRRMTFENVEAIDNAFASGRDVVVYFSHTSNWEWTPSIRLHSHFCDNPDVEFGQIYRPLKNKAMDRIMFKIRSRFGSRSIPKATALRQFVSYRRQKRLFVVGFMSDQTPKHESTRLVLSFFGRPTSVITGTEVLARRLDTTVVYWHMSKPERGHYHVRVVPMAESAAETKPGELTAAYFKLLEENIKAQPSLWLWTHKRWKSSPKTWEDVEPETLTMQ